MSGRLRFSPSSIDRWAYCTASVKELSRLPRAKAGPAAMEGRLAAMVLEDAIKAEAEDRDRHWQYREARPTDYFDMEGHKVAVTQRMLDGVNFALNYIIDVIGLRPMRAEGKVDLDFVRPGQTGYFDVISWGPVTDIFDYKNGTRQVDARETWQVRLYGRALLPEARLLGVERFRFHIIQPNAPRKSSEETMTLDEVEAWYDQKVAPRVHEAVTEGVFRPGDKACQWCDLRDRCKARVSWVTRDLPQPSVDPMPGVTAYTPEQIGTLLPWFRRLAKLASDVEKHAYALELSGVDVPGWRLGVGRKGDRAFIDTPEAHRAIVQFCERHEVPAYTAPKLRSPAAIEKDVGKPKMKELKPRITQPDGKPKLVPDDDPAPEFHVAKAGAEAFIKDQETRDGD